MYMYMYEVNTLLRRGHSILKRYDKQGRRESSYDDFIMISYNANNSRHNLWLTHLSDANWRQSAEYFVISLGHRLKILVSTGGREGENRSHKIWNIRK